MTHEYLYHFTTLYPEKGHLVRDSLTVVEGEEVCYDVQPVPQCTLGQIINGKVAKAWTFSVRGREGRFITHYDWTLIRVSGDNRIRLMQLKRLREQKAEIEKRTSEICAEMDTAASDLQT